MEIIPVFISVDPERDNVEQVCEYVKGILSTFFGSYKWLVANFFGSLILIMD